MIKGRHARLKRYFSVYDTDRDGTISRDDFELQARRRIAALRLDEGSPGAKAARQVYEAFWEGLRTRCDLDDNGKVSLTEWIQVWDDVAHTAESFADLPPWFRSMFDSLCRSLFRGSDEMSAADLESLLKALGRGDLKAAARRELLGDKDRLTRGELEQLWFRYLCGDEDVVPDVLFG